MVEDDRLIGQAVGQGLLIRLYILLCQTVFIDDKPVRFDKPLLL